MTRGDAEIVVAAVTLDRSAPADRILRRGGAADEPGVIVSCRVQARLVASPYEFELSERKWVERSLLTADTRRWSWYVTPKVGGDHTLILNVRPIMRIKASGDVPVSVLEAASSNVQEYETAVHVDVPWTERPQETMSRIAATLEVAEGLVRAATALLAALLALLAVLGVRRRTRRSPPAPRAGDGSGGS
ncbi:MAG: hypothetical protein M3141_03430 [Actinomycetota bacterium]|nr:hypothetical protein [Actinomycetota bacterium]